ncbi:uncharacterized protein EAE97_004436 [Botrytis byssoidea]|uniref:Uncharacterized protein n=1 Tax=Botrytis byssoidea TaxID=139641 RepID=A0A9P5IQC7_9HELO|nr:uncharacterized protein EAE97_004436 [Botrytis byssoidea]KAF7947187.1 hypothetical protein EAE97_004436 [Botrytis byssoidea]
MKLRAVHFLITESSALSKSQLMRAVYFANTSGCRTTLPSTKTPLNFYIRVLYGKRVGMLVDVGEAAVLEDLKDLANTQTQPLTKVCYNRRENHENCGRVIGTNILPTRLIDVGTMNNESVRLTTTMDSMEPYKHPYLILSYCRGRGNDVAKTTTGNLEDRLRSFNIAYLPKTI